MAASRGRRRLVQGVFRNVHCGDGCEGGAHNKVKTWERQAKTGKVTQAFSKFGSGFQAEPKRLFRATEADGLGLS